MPPSVGILTALPGEARALGLGGHPARFSASPEKIPTKGGRDLVHLHAGPGPERAGAAARRLLDAGVSLLCVTGVSGGLAPGLRPGDLVLGDRIVGPGMPAPGLPLASADLDALLRRAALDCRTGALYASTTAVTSPEQKARLHRETGALAVDTESGAAAQAASSGGVACLSLRAVCDGSAVPIPFDPKDILRADGSSDARALVHLLVSRPTAAGALIGLGRSYRRALRCLRGAWTVLVRPESLERMLRAAGWMA